MIYIFEDSRIIYGSENLYPEDEGKYISTEQLPTITPIEGKTGYYYADLSDNKIVIGYFDTPEPPEPIKEPFPEIPPVTNEELMQSVMYLTAVLAIAEAKRQDTDNQQMIEGVMAMSFGNSPKYDFWRNAYFRKHTNIATLDMLVTGDILTQSDVDIIVAERLAEFGE